MGLPTMAVAMPSCTNFPRVKVDSKVFISAKMASQVVIRALTSTGSTSSVEKSMSATKWAKVSLIRLRKPSIFRYKWPVS